MKRYLRIVAVADEQTVFRAIEYNATSFQPEEVDVPLNLVVWRSEALSVDELIKLLLSRGWHQTDIGDALHEARRRASGA